MMKHSNHLLSDFVALFYPNYCLSCEDALLHGEQLLCSRCLLELPRTNFHKDLSNDLFRRLQYQQSIKSAVALFRFGKSGKVQNLLHALKYRNRPEVGFYLGLHYGKQLNEEWLGNRPELLVPIPLHRRKMIRRGYNQSEEFARGLSESLEIDLSSTALKRTRYTETQTARSKLGRWENVSDVFEVTNSDLVGQKRIAIVDDVVTTGATVEAASSALINSGCSEITVISLAYADGK